METLTLIMVAGYSLKKCVQLRIIPLLGLGLFQNGGSGSILKFHTFNGGSISLLPALIIVLVKVFVTIHRNVTYFFKIGIPLWSFRAIFSLGIR